MRFGIRQIIRGLVLPLVLGGGVARAQTPSAPAVIKIGTLYASTGPFADTSEGQFKGLEYWANDVNKTGGVFVKAFDRKIPVKIIAYDDQSSPSTATDLYNQLITQDHVDLLTSDFGSVLTSVAIPLAAEHHMLLIDPAGSGGTFFTKKTNYLAEISVPTSSLWPIPLGHFLLSQKISRVAILYDSNDFAQSQAETIDTLLKENGVTPVYYHGVPTSETNYTVLLHTIAAQRPEAVLEFGYPPNDIAFLRTLSHSGLHFNMVFTVFPGPLFRVLLKNVGAQGLAYTYTYPTPPLVQYNQTTVGPTTAAFVKDYTAVAHKAPNFFVAIGYNTGIIMQQMLAVAPTFNQLAFHQALMDMSGKTTTFVGNFKINENGAQIGELQSVAQLVPEGKGLKTVIIYPQDKATGAPIYPAPRG